LLQAVGSCCVLLPIFLYFYCVFLALPVSHWVFIPVFNGTKIIKKIDQEAGKLVNDVHMEKGQ